jgi:hypothetical protein
MPAGPWKVFGHGGRLARAAQTDVPDENVLLVHVACGCSDPICLSCRIAATLSRYFVDRRALAELARHFVSAWLRQLPFDHVIRGKHTLLL